jgi:hypothetical protein
MTLMRSRSMSDKSPYHSPTGLGRAILRAGQIVIVSLDVGLRRLHSNEEI